MVTLHDCLTEIGNTSHGRDNFSVSFEVRFEETVRYNDRWHVPLLNTKAATVEEVIETTVIDVSFDL